MVAPRLLGAAVSVAGPAHLSEDTECQDASGWVRAGDLLLGVAADGLGAYPDSARGAALAVRLALEMAPLLGDLSAGDEQALRGFTALLADRWLSEGGGRECPCTLLLACLARWGGAAVQIGDGAIWAAYSDGSVHRLSPEPDFSGVTNHLAEPGAPARAALHLFAQAIPCGFVLATDGVDGDLLLEEQTQFVRSVLSGLTAEPDEFGWQLRKDLEEWPTPGHSDDKSLVCISMGWRNDL
jgi:hypothetical protein